MKKWLFIFLSIGIISSCINEVNISDNNEDDLTYTTGELKIYLQNPVSTRSGWEYDAYFPDADIFSDDSEQERWLHNISLVYFDSDMLLETFAVDHNFGKLDRQGIDNYANPSWEKGYPEYMIFTIGLGNFPLTAGAHYFYVFCNAPDEYLTTIKELYDSRKKDLTKDELEKTVLKGFTIEDVVAPFTSRLGTSQPRCMMTNITSPEAHYMGSSVGYQFPAINNVTIDIGKSFAKVSLAYIPQDNNNDRLSEVQYRILNDPKEIYLLPNIFDKQVYTPHFDKWQGGNFQQYYDEYFNEKSGISKIEDPENTFFAWRAASQPDDRIPKEINDGDEPYRKTHAYCFENGNKTPLQGNSTMVLIKAKYTPEEWLNPNGEIGSASGDGTFWRIRNSEGFYSGYYNDKPLVSGSLETIKYVGGITYYPIWLKTDGIYQVKRNHYYKLAITAVKSAGAPDLDSVMSPDTQLIDSSTETRSTAYGNTIPEASNGIIWEQNN